MTWMAREIRSAFHHLVPAATKNSHGFYAQAHVPHEQKIMSHRLGAMLERLAKEKGDGA